MDAEGYFLALILEDDEDQAIGLSEWLWEEQSIVSQVAKTISAARTAWLKDEYEFLFVDRMLPDGDGAVFALEVREEDGLVPVAVLSASTAATLGVATSFFRKPIDLEALADWIAGNKPDGFFEAKKGE